MVELRKRREAPSNVAEPPLKKTTSLSEPKLGLESKAKAGPSPNGANKAEVIKVGHTVDLEGFGGEVETQDGEKATLKKLIDESKSGVVLFTYPKASTPGCTTQACLFRDHYASLTATGYSIFGLSTDSTKSNTTFKTKQNLPYTLLCDPKATLISAIGFKKTPKGTTRGVCMVSKTGRVEAAEPGGPAATLEVVRKLVQNEASSGNVANSSEVEQDSHNIEANDDGGQRAANISTGDSEGIRAEVAAEVADTAQKLDAGAET
ncbi:MAG: hypothetical protein L6R41_001497 [Letrouitia leprolyta]|nr:MAG: hypothetical protein L6R41_001497 [Letrouitia leprolyta]